MRSHGGNEELLLAATSCYDCAEVNRLPIKATSTTSTQILYINAFVYKHIYVKLYQYIKTSIYTRAPLYIDVRATIYRRARM